MSILPAQAAELVEQLLEEVQAGLTKKEDAAATALAQVQTELELANAQLQGYRPTRLHRACPLSSSDCLSHVSHPCECVRAGGRGCRGCSGAERCTQGACGICCTCGTCISIGGPERVSRARVGAPFVLAACGQRI